MIFLYLYFQDDHFFDLAKEPLVDFGEVLNGIEGKAGFKGVVNVEQTVPRGIGQAVFQFFLISFFTSVCA
ncbi:hypothetical protein FQZ97_1058050 [compost metagenome]